MTDPGMFEGQPAHPTRHFRRLEGGRVRCDVCPRECRLRDGQRGMCFVRAASGGEIVLTTYGRSSGYCVDPIEKKPLNHFFPGSSVLSFGTAGCNLTCKFCQNWDISKSREMDTLMDAASPERIAEAAQELGCTSVAFTYNDPVVFLEYAADVAKACRDAGIKTVAVTAGYVMPEPARDLFEHMDAANVDLKAFTEGFYQRIAGGHLEPVLATLRYLRRETDVWTELTNLVIPTKNDAEDETARLCAWVVSELGPDVPIHFTAFHPDYKMRDLPSTPAATLARAREVAIREGVRFAYTGNVHDRAGDTTRCAACGDTLIVRDWYAILDYRLRADGTCPRCSTALPGVFGSGAGGFGARRVPVRLRVAAAE